MCKLVNVSIHEESFDFAHKRIENSVSTRIQEELRTETESLLPYVAPILVYPALGLGADSYLTGGTALLVRTKHGRFLITADHVVAEIDKLKDSSDIIMLLGIPGARFTETTEWPVIARNDQADICTILIPQKPEYSVLNAHCYELDENQPIRARVGDKALILGFPKLHREATQDRINTRSLSIMDYVTHVAGRRFTIADESNGREILINPHNLSFPDHVGGMSGAPVFRISGSTPPAVIGILSQSGDGLRGAYFCSHADFILPDGTLDISALPPRL